VGCVGRLSSQPTAGPLRPVAVTLPVAGHHER